MTWFIFAALTALSESSKDLFSKIGLSRMNEYLVSWVLMTFSIPLLTVALILSGIPEIGPHYLIALFVHGTLNTLAIILYMRAIKSSELSITVPMVAFSPLFLLITSPIIVGEFPSTAGLIGVVLIVAGSYLLHLNQLSRGVLMPFKALFEQPGPRYMMLVAFLWSITANFDKIGVRNSSPMFWSFSLAVFMSLAMLPVALLTNRNLFSTIRKNLRCLIPIGFFQGCALLFQMLAVQLTLVAYVVAIKRTSTALSVIWGAIFLKEKNIKEKLLGVGIMLAGVTLIVLN
ncbi:MAG: EamA family transporter [Sediminispirochaetaceae bacterium]